MAVVKKQKRRWSVDNISLFGPQGPQETAAELERAHEIAQRLAARVQEQRRARLAARIANFGALVDPILVQNDTKPPTDTNSLQ